jgi:hypothetical protein
VIAVFIDVHKTTNQRKNIEAVCSGLILVAAVLTAATTASAQMDTMQRGSSEKRDTGRADQIDRSRSRSGTALGIEIGTGILLDQLSRSQDGQAKTRTSGGSGGRTKERGRAARKGDPAKGKGGGNAGPPPPTSVPGDPPDGFTVDGGFVHRGTGMTRDRKAIFCWVTSTDKKKCEQFKQFQFVTINVKTKWGNGPEQDANAEINKQFPKGIQSRTTATFVPGELNADDYPDRNDNPEKKASMTDPAGKEVKAGPYKPDTIPGVKGASGLIDAPSWYGFSPKIFDAIAPKDIKTLPPNKTQPNKPDDTELGTIKFLQHFRTYVYCMKPYKCLGYFEWDYDETVTFFVTWTETEASLGSKVGMDTGPVGGKKKTKADIDKEEAERPKNWKASFGAKSNVDGPKSFTGWKDPC